MRSDSARYSLGKIKRKSRSDGRKSWGCYRGRSTASQGGLLGLVGPTLGTLGHACTYLEIACRCYLPRNFRAVGAALNLRYIESDSEPIPEGMSTQVMNGNAKSGFTLLNGHSVPPASPQEVRCAVRFPLTLPVVVSAGNRQHKATTRNVSASGVLFESGDPLRVGQDIQFSLCMPGAVLGTSHDILVDCRGRVVRCSMSPYQAQIAATIDEYRFVEQ